ncbi:hypothetical protein B0T10DRAFT_606670 [Thelonectria olida]|uniref:Uncharacterized protein n=1 Tax=Thelonectria olida TaxID=1576542 RepID=A0A9P9APT9_9HYPO|nr:hypothetical protein B0T10DRAFT_606670 [Thelonectria olida]
MAKKDFLAKLLGNRLSRVLTRSKRSSKSKTTSPPQDPFTQRYGGPSYLDRSEALTINTRHDLLDRHIDSHVNRHEYVNTQRESASSSRPLTMPSPALSSSVRQSRRASFRQRFWSISSANYFPELDEDFQRRPSVTSPSPDPNRRSAYVPRHAATDFHKTSNNNRRRTISVQVAASERIAARFNNSDDSDDATLCSVNLREDDPEENTRDLDMWLATLHRQQALQALTTPAEPTPHSGPALSPLHVYPHSRHSQTYHSWIPVVESAADSDDEYGVYSQTEADMRRRSRCSLFWAEIDRTALPRPVQDTVLHRNSTYMDVQPPRPPSASSRPASFVGGGTSLAEWTQPQRPMTIARTVSEKRRMSCARSPGVMTVVEMS